MYGVIREYQAPTGVTHAVRGRFGHGTGVWGIVFARKTSIELYNVRANQDTARLELVQSTKIGAPILSMATVRRAGSPTDALWLAFDKMRLVSLTWDAAARSWVLEKALNLASYLGFRHCAVPDIMTSTEFGNPGQKLLRGRAGGVATPVIRADPSGRCIAALATTQDVLYIIPSNVDSVAGNAIPAADEIFVIDLRAEYNAANVKDFVFIQGTFEPIITVLYETKRTWAGRAAVVRNTSSLLSVKIDVRLKKHSKEWFMEKLPFDSIKLESVPYSADQGVLLLAPNVIMQIRHGVCVAGLSLNCFGDAYAKEMKGTYNTIRTSDMLMSLDAGHCRFLDWEDTRSISGKSQNTCLLSLKGGELYFLTLATGSNNTLELQRAGSTVLASEIVPVNDRFFVLASRISDSLLVEYQRTVNDDVGKSSMTNGDSAAVEEAVAEDEADMEIYGLKPSKEEPEEVTAQPKEEDNTLTLTEKDEGTRGVYDDEDELGWVFDLSAEDEKKSKANIHKGNWQLKVKDTLPCFGPGMDLTVGLSPRHTEESLDMVIAGGFAKNGCLAVVHQTVRPEDSTRFEATEKGCKGAWTLRDPSVIRRFAEERRLRNKQTERRNESRRAKNTKKQTARKRFVDDLIAKKTREEKMKIREAMKANKNGAEASNANEAEEDEDKIVPAENSNGDISEKKRKLENTDTEEPLTPKRLKTENGDTVPSDGGKTKQDAEQDMLNLDDIELPEEVIEHVTIDANAEADGLEKFQVEAEDELEPDIEDEELLHGYMLLSTETGTLVLSTGGTELEHVLDKSVEFITEEVTITAGNVMRERVSVQVTKSSIRVVMDGAKQCEHVRAEGSSPIVEAQVLDPHVLLTTADGRCSMFEVRAESYEVQKAKGSEASEQNDMDVMFDEYGNELPSTNEEKLGEKSKGLSNGDATKTAAGEKEADGDKEISFRNFSLVQKFESPEPSGSAEHVSSACLFKGSLATDLVRELSKKDKSTVEQDTEHNKNAEEVQVKEEESVEKAEVKPEPQEADNLDEDEDERMLYGDDDGGVDEEEELMLYGDGGGNAEETKISGTALPLGEDSVKKGEEGPSIMKAGLEKPAASAPVEPEKGVLPLVESVLEEQELLLVVVTKSGTLEVKTPALNFQVILRCDHFFVGPSIVTDNDEKLLDKKLRAPKKYRICKVFLGNVQSSAELSGLTTPILVATTDMGLPLIYTGYLAAQNKDSTRRSSLQFRKIYAADRIAAIFAKSVARTEARKKHSKSTCFSVSKFSNIAGRSGLFVSGSAPFFIFAERGYPRIHALYHKDEADPPTAILTLDELNVVNCRHGFVTVSDNNIVRIGALAAPSEMNFDTPSPMRKINLRCTPHKVAYHAGSATYGVLASMPTPTTRQERMDRILQSLEKHDKRHYQSVVTQREAEDDGAKTRIPPLLEEVHELRVYRADTWEMIKSYKLKKGEVGLSIKNITVNVFKQRMSSQGVEIPSSNKGDDGNESMFAASLKMRPKNMLVVGTGFLNGEDATSKGRLLMFEVSRQDAHMGGEVHTAFQLQLISEKELASPVTAVAAMEGYVICGVGPLISVYKLVGDEIVHLSFQFGQLFCSSIATMKQYLVVGDIRKSVTFMYFRDRNSSVNFLGKDFEHVTTYATEFLMREGEMSIIVTDARGNIHSLQYAHANVPESRGGKRLLVNGGVKFGSQINQLVRIRDNRGVKGFRDRQDGGAGRQGLVFATLDGGIGMIVAVDQEQFEAMTKMTDAIGECAELARYCGIESKTVNEFDPESTATEILGRRVLDSREACELFGMNALQMRKVASNIGVKVPGIAEIMSDIDGILETMS